jgi:hypothetical protein
MKIEYTPPIRFGTSHVYLFERKETHDSGVDTKIVVQLITNGGMSEIDTGCLPDPETAQKLVDFFSRYL